MGAGVVEQQSCCAAVNGSGKKQRQRQQQQPLGKRARHAAATVTTADIDPWRQQLRCLDSDAAADADSSCCKCCAARIEVLSSLCLWPIEQAGELGFFRPPAKQEEEEEEEQEEEGEEAVGTSSV